MSTEIEPAQAVARGSLREELCWRAIRLAVPPLRDRAGDIPLLVHHFMARARQRTGRTEVRYCSRRAAELLCSYPWPGNLRELEQAIERAVLLADGSTIEPQDLPSLVWGLEHRRAAVPEVPQRGLDLRAAVRCLEDTLIRQALERTSWNKNQAARLLGLNRTTLVEMLKRRRLELRRACRGQCAGDSAGGQEVELLALRRPGAEVPGTRIRS